MGKTTPRGWPILLQSAKERGLRPIELARELGCSDARVYYAEKRFGIRLPRREEKGKAYVVEPYVPDGTEQWRPARGCSKYEISSLGRARRINTGRLRAPAWHKRNRYWTMQLPGDDGELKQAYVHRWVAFAFISNPEAKTQINHINSDRNDNSVENLEWTTREENYEHGRPRLRRAVNPRVPSKLSAEQVEAIRRRSAEGATAAVIAAEFGIHHHYAWKIVTGRVRARG